MALLYGPYPLRRANKGGGFVLESDELPLHLEVCRGAFRGESFFGKPTCIGLKKVRTRSKSFEVSDMRSPTRCR